MVHQVVSPESLGQPLSDERKQKRLSQTDVGQTVGLAQYLVSKIERGGLRRKLSDFFREAQKPRRKNWAARRKGPHRKIIFVQIYSQVISVRIYVDIISVRPS